MVPLTADYACERWLLLFATVMSISDFGVTRSTIQRPGAKATQCPSAITSAFRSSVAPVFAPVVRQRIGVGCAPFGIDEGGWSNRELHRSDASDARLSTSPPRRVTRAFGRGAVQGKASPCLLRDVGGPDRLAHRSPGRRRALPAAARADASRAARGRRDRLPCRSARTAPCTFSSSSMPGTSGCQPCRPRTRASRNGDTCSATR